jgi:TRAP-type C4-dicarboxylate transport system substrate-binding protein
MRPWALFGMLALLTGCGSPPSRSGVPVAPVQLRAVYGNGPGTVGGDVLDAIVAAARSGSIAFTPPVAGQEGEPFAIAELRKGAADVSVVRAGVLEEAGATSLAALQAPLGDWTEVQMRRVTRAPIATELLGGLRRIGLVGLALVPGGVRHPVGYGMRTLASLADFAGATVNDPSGATSRDVVRHLGATPDSSVLEPRTLAVRAGRLKGIITSLLQPQAVDDGGRITANLILEAKFDVVVVRASVYDALTAAQRHELARAVAAGAARAVAARPDEARALERWCGLPGYGAVLADQAAIAEIATAVAPVLRRIAADPLGARALDVIRKAHAGTAPPPAHACTPTSPHPVPVPRLRRVGDQHRIDGTWRIVWDADRMRAVPGTPETYIAENQGTWTWHLAGGRATARQPRPDQPDCLIEYVLAVNRFWLTFEAPGSTCEYVIAGTYVLDGDRLVLHVTADSAGPQWLALDDVLFRDGFRRVRS